MDDSMRHLKLSLNTFSSPSPYGRGDGGEGTPLPCGSGDGGKGTPLPYGEWAREKSSPRDLTEAAHVIMHITDHLINRHNKKPSCIG